MSREAIDIFNEGYYYYTGTNGYPLNYNKSLELFEKAAALGNPDAMNNLGIMYKDGKGVVQNYCTAAEWYYKAIQADENNANAIHNLACLYYNGNGVGKDINKAFSLFKTSVDIGTGNTTAVYPNSCNMVGEILMFYYKNNKEAFFYFNEAAKYGNIPEAWHNLGVLCEKGLLNRNHSDTLLTACGFYKKAANLGLAESMDSVGRIYASFREYNKARPWIQAAAKKGYEPAKKRLKMLDVAQGGSLLNLLK